MGWVIRIAFRCRKQVGGAIRSDHGQENPNEDSRGEQKCRARRREKPQGGMPVGARSQYSSAAIRLAQKIWVLP